MIREDWFGVVSSARSEKQENTSLSDIFSPPNMSSISVNNTETFDGTYQTFPVIHLHHRTIHSMSAP